MRRRFTTGAASLAAASLVFIGCTNTRTSTSPTENKCQVSVAGSSAMVAASGGSTTVRVTAEPECAWSAVADASWIAELRPPSGQGNSDVQVSIAANSTPSNRQANVTINGTAVPIAQEAAPCRFTLAEPAGPVPTSGGTVTVTVTSVSGCSWTAQSSATWLTPTSNASGNGSGSVTFTATANTGASRSAFVTIGDQTVSVSQAAVPDCVVVVSPLDAVVPVTGGTLPITVTTPGQCLWTASSPVPWISPAPASGSGSSIVTLTVAPNTTAGDRSSTVSVGGQPVSIAQGGVGCSYSLNPTSHSAAATAGAASFAVTTNGACAWTASTGAPWITLTGTASGIGNGTVSLLVAQNTGPARSDAIRVADQTFTVNQAAAPPTLCSYALSGTTQPQVPAAGGTGQTVTVTTTAACTWGVSTPEPWITITSPTTVTGSGTLTFTVAANPTSSPRSGVITVAGESVTVTQAAAGCTYTINPASQSIAAAGGAGSTITVTTTAGCAWTATSNAPWLTNVSPTSGSGGGSVTFTVVANTGGARQGTLTIAGQTFTVDQAGVAACSYSIAPTSQNIGSAGGAGSTITVSTTPGCAWTATSNASWLTGVTPTSGTGGGTVTFAVAPNTGAARQGTLTVAGQTFTVNQAAAAACAYSINPATQNVSSSGGAGRSIEVTTTAACAWTAVSNASWLTIPGPAAGTGNGTVAFNVAANMGPARSGTLTVAGQTATVNQGCATSINPSSATIGRGGVTNSPVTVTAATGCSWTAVVDQSATSWLTVTSGAAGSGNGTVTFSVASTTPASLPRTGRITIGTAILTVEQR